MFCVIILKNGISKKIKTSSKYSKWKIFPNPTQSEVKGGTIVTELTAPDGCFVGGGNIYGFIVIKILFLWRFDTQY